MNFLSQRRFLTKGRFIQLLIGVMLFVCYHLSFPANRSESDDGYMYARIVAQEHPPATELYDLKFVLFLPTAHALFSVVKQIHPTADAYLMMCGLSSFCAVLTLLIFYRLLHHLCGLENATALLGTAFLGAAYHFWRYAVEAEVYLPAILLITALFYLSLRALNKGISLPVAALSALLAGAAVLVYKPNMIPVAFLLLLMFLRPQNRLITIGIGTAAAVIIMAGYYQVFRLTDNGQESFVHYLFTGTQSPHRVAWNAVKLAAVTGSLLLAPNFMYGIPAVQNFVRQSFTGQYVQDDIFAASQFPMLTYAALFTLAICIALFIALLIRGIRQVQSATIYQPRHWVVAAWLLVYLILLVVQLDSFSPEPFVPLLLPAAYLTAVLLFEPSSARLVLPAAFVAALFCHNLLGGFGMVYSPKTEWLHCQQEWLINNARPQDVVIIHGSIVTHKKLSYRTGASVIHTSVFFDSPFTIADTIQSAGRVFLLADLPTINRSGYQAAGSCSGHLYLVNR